MKKLLSLLLICLMLTPAALADDLLLGDHLFGTAVWPEGSDTDNATYLYRYSYPTLAGDDGFSVMVNEYYTYLVDDALSFTVPINGESLDPSDTQATTDIIGTITCMNEKYLSIRVVNTTQMGASSSVIYSAQTFARTGSKAGNVISLPYLLGILEKGDTTDEWLETRQTAKADDCVRQMVWDAICQQKEAGIIAYYDDLTYDQLCGFFYPEEDFYLDENGNPVFFIEETMAAPQSEGALFFPMALEDILDEL